MDRVDASRDDEWELSKENAQPIKEGRTVVTLNETLGIGVGTSNEETPAMKQQRQTFELELRTYSGEDALDVWHRYILWVEENFPRQGKRSNLQMLLERAVRVFVNDEKYTNDPRYLDVWLKFTNCCSDPLEIFNFLHSKGIGSGLAAFYEAWAWQVERVGNSKKADTIYTTGIQCMAEPTDVLVSKHREFQARLMQQIARQRGEDEEDSTALEGGEQQRLALGELRGQGKKGKVPVNRVANLKPGSRFKLDKPTSQGNAGQSFQIFQDENASPNVDIVAPQPAAWASVPDKSDAVENEQKAGHWGKAKVKSKGVPSIKITEMSSVVKSSFAPFEDEVSDQPIVQTPRKIDADFNKQVLSTKKVSKLADPLTNIEKGFHNEPGQMPMYCKHKIYAGTQEFTFEELRAANYRKKKEEKEKEEQVNAVAAENEQLRLKQEMLHDLLQQQGQQLQLQRQSLQQLQDQFTKEKLMSSSVEEAGPVSMNTGDLERLHNCETASQPGPRSQAAMTQQVNPAAIQAEAPPQLPAPVAVPEKLLQSASETSIQNRTSSGPKTNRNLNFDNSSLSQVDTSPSTGGPIHPNLHRTAPSAESSINTNSASGAALTLSTTSSGGSQKASFLDISAARPTQKSDYSITAPSPTINTREAYCTVMKMFNKSLNNNSIFGWDKLEEEDEEMPDTGADPPVAAEPKSLPFTFFDENAHTTAPVVLKDNEQKTAQQCAVSSFQMFEDEPQKQMLPPKKIPLQQQSFKTPCSQDKENSRPLPGQFSVHCDDAVASGAPPSSSAGFQVAETLDCETPMDDVEVISEPKDWQMEEGDLMPSEMTFAPGFSSTCNFAALSRLASTPFNPRGDMAQLPQPPLSNIKNRNATNHHSETCTNTTSMVDESPSMSSAEMLKQRRSSVFTVTKDQHNLSPIEEDSNEKTHGSTHSTDPSSGTSQYHTTLHSTTHSIPVTTPAATTSAMATPLSPTPPGGMTLPSTASFLKLSSQPELSRNRDLSMTRAPVSSLPSLTSCDEPQPMQCGSQEDVQDGDLPGNITCLDIDITNYISDKEEGAGYEDPLNMSVAIDPADPFDSDAIERFLSRLPQPLSVHPKYHHLNEKMPTIKIHSRVTLGRHIYAAHENLGNGAYARILSVQAAHHHTSKHVLKIQKPACPWEFYISNQLQQRLSHNSGLLDRELSFMTIDEAYIFQDGSCLLNSLHPYGNILNLVNFAKRERVLLSTALIVVLAIEILQILECLQQANIIHGDLKPDNFLICALPTQEELEDPTLLFGKKTRFLKLIDYGRSIDMNMYPAGTTFMAKVKTKGFQCPEMRMGRPWTHQTDMFGAAATIHVLIFLDYMKVTQQAIGKKLSPTAVVSTRRWKHMRLPLEELMVDLMNIPSCDKLPDLARHRAELQQQFMSKPMTNKTAEKTVVSDFTKQYKLAN